MQQDGFNVLAGTQAIDVKIHALAGELAMVEVADFDRVS